MHFLFVTSPLQGHINPVRRLAARVMAANPDALVTFSTAVSGHRRMFPSLARPDDEAVDAAGVLHVPFSDGFDDGFSSAAPGAGASKPSSSAARASARGAATSARPTPPSPRASWRRRTFRSSAAASAA